MEHDVFQEVLDLLKEVRYDLTRSADSSAAERVDEVIDLLSEAREEDGLEDLDAEEILEAVSKILPAVGSLAELIDTLIQSFC